MKQDKDRNDRRKIVLFWTIILLILYFIVMTLTLVLSGKDGNFTDSIVPVILLSVAVIIPVIGMNVSLKKNDDDKD